MNPGVPLMPELFGERSITVDDRLPLRVRHVGFESLGVEPDLGRDAEHFFLCHLVLTGEQCFMKFLMFSLAREANAALAASSDGSPRIGKSL